MNILLLTVTMMGCGEKTTSSNESDTNPDSPEETIVLQEGHWLYGEGELLSSTCPDPEGEGGDTLIEEAGFTLKRISDEQFSIQPDGSSDEILCEVQGQQFECERVSSIETFTFEGDIEGFPLEMDVTLAIDTQSIGFVYEETDMKFTFTVGFECHDVDNALVDCDAVSQESGLPCQIQFSVEAQPD